MPEMATANGRALVRLEGVSRTFTMGDVSVPALREVSMTVERGEVLVVLGPSGSGKSTLLNVIGGIDRPTAGRVWFAQTELSGLDDGGLTAYRRQRVGFIFQFYNLVPTLTAYENVLSAAELVDDPLEADAALEMVGLADRAGHFPAQLSGGEQQRVSIARALAKRPELLLADEPTGALDLEMARQVLGVLQRLNRDGGLTVVLITHNLAIAAIADRSVHLVSGRVTETTSNAHPIPAGEVSW